MTPRKPRELRPEEKQLWDKVRQSAVPIQKNVRQVIVDAVEQPRVRPDRAPIRHFRLGEAAPATRPQYATTLALSSQLSAAPLQMDSKSFGRMKRGKLQPEGRLDLHGMTTEQAHPALVGFVLAAHGDGKRLILVITGKGRSSLQEGPIPVRHGVLRHQVPGWLRASPLGPLVLQISESHQRHGGSGALYVYLRRGR